MCIRDRALTAVTFNTVGRGAASKGLAPVVHLREIVLSILLHQVINRKITGDVDIHRTFIDAVFTAGTGNGLDFPEDICHTGNSFQLDVYKRQPKPVQIR